MGNFDNLIVGSCFSAFGSSIPVLTRPDWPEVPERVASDRCLPSELSLMWLSKNVNVICLIFFAFFFMEPPPARAEKIDNRNFAIDTCYPNQSEIRAAEQRAKRFWAKHASRFGTDPRYLAVAASKIFPAEVQELWPKLINSETTASFFAHGLEDNTYSDLQLTGVLIYDTAIGNFVSNQGYISVDTPGRGRVARFGHYLARYIGWG